MLMSIACIFPRMVCANVDCWKLEPLGEFARSDEENVCCGTGPYPTVEPCGGVWIIFPLVAVIVGWSVEA